MNTSADIIWSKITLHAGLDRDDIRSCQLEAGCIQQVSTLWNLAGIALKADAVEDLADLGRQWVEPKDGVPAKFGPFLVDEAIVGTIVAALTKSADREFLDAVMKVLAKSTPDALVRNHASVLESALAHRKDLEWRGLLIGKLGSQRGLRMIQDSKSYLEGNPHEGLAVLGKLGRGDAERKLIDAYMQEKNDTPKAALAELMGYMGTPKALNTLAADLRTPFTYAWNQMAQRSFRLHVIKALSQAYPFEPLLWVPFNPTGDAYYEEIENWAIKTLGMNFSRPRPPFLYQEDAPTGKRR